MLKKYFLHKKALLLLGGILLIVLFISLRQADQRQTSSPALEPILNKADVEVKKMELSETEGGELEWNLRAERAEVYEKRGIAYLQDITLEYLLNEGEEVVLTGERGEINLGRKDIFLRGNVGASSYHIQLKTDTLSWNRQKRELLTEDPVWLKRENVEITGRGMVADMSLKKIRLNKNVRTVIH
ncbi:MAG: LPS export ABC transporter periplasmic protein LptC [bacterium]